MRWSVVDPNADPCDGEFADFGTFAGLRSTRLKGDGVAIATNVNYAVQYDGSAASNMVHAGWAGYALLDE